MNEAGHMRLALELARLGEGDVNPNPLVGVVIEKDGHIVGRGYHRRYGGPHAEVFALNEAGDAARGATLITPLEPCSHHGKTPPCTDRIIAAGIARVIVGVRDPNPLISGRGIEQLRAAGIDVVEGVLAEECRVLNEVFLHYITRRLPFVQLKMATSLDGRIATRAGDAKWISCEASRIEAHRMRRRLSSILVGVGTVIADDPRLSVRHVFGRNPVPIVLDPSGRIPIHARILSSDPPPIIVTDALSAAKEQQLTERGARVWRIPTTEGHFILPKLLKRLGEESIDSVLIEGGGETAATFLSAGLVDKVTWFVAPLLIGGRDAVPAVGGIGAQQISDAVRLERVSLREVGDDLLYSGYPVR